MASNLDRYKGDLKRLVDFGETLLLALDSSPLDDAQLQSLGYDVNEETKAFVGADIFFLSYQRWYTEASAVVRQLMPDRIIEFEQLYKGDGRGRDLGIRSFTIQDWLNGVRYRQQGFLLVKMRFHNQVAILGAAQGRFESSLFDIRQMIQADLLDSELDAARELAKHSFLRGAGAIAGVVLEKHLSQVAENHTVRVRKKHPTISDFNDLLKDRDVLDIPTWRQIQRLSDIRNLCDHNKDREPTRDEVEELINGVEKASKSLF
ncbi:MAG: hypothetical protein OXF97_09840 [Nitrospira sp.]|nr:hypothetical protein [Nitrospira sp.]